VGAIALPVNGIITERTQLSNDQLETNNIVTGACLELDLERSRQGSRRLVPMVNLARNTICLALQAHRQIVRYPSQYTICLFICLSCDLRQAALEAGRGEGETGVPHRGARAALLIRTQVRTAMLRGGAD
jgi:hypothetical protein